MNHIVFLYQDRLYTGQMETPGTFVIGSGKKDQLKIEPFSAKITIREDRNGNLSVESSGSIYYQDHYAQKDTILPLDLQNRTVLFITDRQTTSRQTVKLPYNCTATVGRSSKSDIIIKNPFVSGRHFTIRSEAGIIRVEDHDSTNGLYLNGKRISKAQFHSGDVLSIIHMRIRLVGNELYFDNVDQALTIRGVNEGPGTAAGVAKVKNSGQGTLTYRRSPRIQEQLPMEDIILAAPPAAQPKYEKRRGIFQSLAGSGAMLAVSVATSAMSPALMAARAASLISPVTSAVSQSGSEKQRKARMAEYEQMRQEKYGHYIQEQKARIEEVARIQREVLTRENPSAQQCLKDLEQMKRSLWERSAADRDFLDVRLGMGYEELCVNVRSRDEGGFRMDSDEVRELAQDIVEETRIVDNVPSRLPLRKFNTIGIVGQRQRMIRLVKNMIVSLTTAHCFEEVRIVGLFDEAERECWESLRWLPHVWDENRQFRYLAFNRKEAKSLRDLFVDVLGSRMKEPEDGYRRRAEAKVHYVFLLGSRELMEREELMDILSSNDPSMGATAMFLFDEMYSLPHSCQFIVDVDHGPCGYVRNEVNKKFIFTEDPAVTDEQFDRYARKMSAIELEGITAQTEIP